MSVADEVLKQPEYERGELVVPLALADRLGATSMDVRAACKSLLERGQLMRDGMNFRKAQRHWIHRRRLA